MQSQKIRIRLKAFDYKLLDQSTAEIVNTARRTGAKIAGPIPLPTRINKYTVLRSPHVDKKSREQFEIRTHKRMLDILEPTQQTVDQLMKLDLSAGVDVEIKLSAVQESQVSEVQTNNKVKLDGLFAFKVGMTTVYNEAGEAVPVTVLKYENWFVSQLKTSEKDGYQAVQIACGPKKLKNSSKSEKGHLKAAGFENGAKYIKEIRMNLPEGIAPGQMVDLASLNVGDSVKISAKSKGRGFAGSVKRFNFAGGPASHGSDFHRRPGSGGQRTWPSRVMPGKGYPGHYGDETITIKNVKVVGVIPEENAILVKGPVPGARNGLVKLVKEQYYG